MIQNLKKKVIITTPFIAGILITLMKSMPPLSFPLKKTKKTATIFLSWSVSTQLLNCQN